MPGTGYESDPDFDPQDRAETFDESMTVGGEGDLSLGGDSPVRPVEEELRTYEEMPDVYDVTTRAGDRDRDEELALDAAEFDLEAIDAEGVEDDNELDYAAADAEHEDDLDGQGADPGAEFDEDQLLASDIEGLEEVRDGDEVSGGEDDFTNFQSRNVGDEDLKRMGYSETRDGQTRAKPDGR